MRLLAKQEQMLVGRPQQSKGSAVQADKKNELRTEMALAIIRSDSRAPLFETSGEFVTSLKKG